jgi:hypothetical protein
MKSNQVLFIQRCGESGIKKTEVNRKNINVSKNLSTLIKHQSNYT